MNIGGNVMSHGYWDKSYRQTGPRLSTFLFNLVFFNPQHAEKLSFLCSNSTNWVTLSDLLNALKRLDSTIDDVSTVLGLLQKVSHHEYMPLVIPTTKERGVFNPIVASMWGSGIGVLCVFATFGGQVFIGKVSIDDFSSIYDDRWKSVFSGKEAIHTNHGYFYDLSAFEDVLIPEELANEVLDWVWQSTNKN